MYRELLSVKQAVGKKSDINHLTMVGVFFYGLTSAAIFAWRDKKSSFL